MFYNIRAEKAMNKCFSRLRTNVCTIQKNVVSAESPKKLSNVFFCIWNRFLFNALSEMNSGLVFSHNLTHTEIICIPAIIFQAHLSNTFACILGPKSQIFFFLSFFVRNYMVQVLNLEQGPSLPVKWVCQGGWCAALRTSLHRFSEVEIFTLCFWDPLLFPLIFTESFHSSLWINTTALFWYSPFFTLREWLWS